MMNGKEKILAIIVGSFVAVFVLYMTVDKLVFAKIKSIKAQQARATSALGLNKISKEKYLREGARLPGLLAKTFGSDENVASERVRARLDGLLKSGNLGISLTPQGGSKIQGRYKEVTWQVDTRGEMADLINFLFLLDKEPYLHRIEGLTLTPELRAGKTKLKLRFITLAPAKWKGKDIAPGEVAEKLDRRQLDTAQRKIYDLITLRDAFRPYRKYNPPPKRKPPPKPPAEKKPAPKPPPPPDRQKVISLATWAGQQEVHVQNLTKNITEVLRSGDELAGGKILMIDYRRMPMPDKPDVLSPSRVIVIKDGWYWAIELGQEATKSHRLTEKDLPEELQPK